MLSQDQIAAVRSVKKSLVDIARVFEELSDVRDRRYRMRTYKKCFLGGDAVDLLLEILKQFNATEYTRDHAVSLGRLLATKFNLFVHVTNDHPLRDDYYMYRFRHQNLRKNMPTSASLLPNDDDETAKYLTQLLEGAYANNDTDDDRVFDETTAFRMMIESLRGRGYRASVSTTPSSPRFSIDQSLNHSSSSIVSDLSELDSQEVDLQQLAQYFESGIEVKTHRVRGAIYTKSFIGSDAVDFLLSCRYANSRGGAVQLGRRLLESMNLFQPCGGNHSFEDDYLFYSFTEPSERLGTDRASKELRDLPLEDIATQFEAKVSIRDRTYRLKKYAQCFVGSEAVTCLLKVSTVSTRREALELGRLLAEKYNLFHHVAGVDEHKLEDDYFFYRFVNVDDRIRRDTSQQEPVILLDTAQFDFMDLQRIANRFREGVTVSTHSYRLKRYRHCFIGSDAVDFLVNSDLAPSRKKAVEIGRRLSEELGLFHHVTKAHRFSDDRLFFRYSGEDDMDASTISERQLPLSKLKEIAKSMRRDIKVKNRRWYHRVYRNCFLGTEAVSYLVAQGQVETRSDAILLGRQIANQCNLFEHVEGDHELKDEKLFYRFLEEEGSYQTRNIEDLRKIADEFLEGVKVGDHRYHLRVYRKTFVGEAAVQFLLGSGIAKNTPEAVEVGRSLAKTFNLFEHVTRDHEFSDAYLFFRINPEEERRMWQKPKDREEAKNEDLVSLTWEQKILRYERKSKLKMVGGHFDLSATRPQIWAATFRRLDPRWRILEYFNEVAQLGVEGITKGHNLDSLHPLLRLVSRASVFSVWRPTQNDAIRRLMKGEAVGKGLNIKGKSAKRGKLAGYVPFLQISDNRHKRMIRTIPKGGRVRIFFGGNCYYARDQVVDYLESVGEEMMETVRQARDVLGGNAEGDIDDAKEALLWDIEDPGIVYIDDYGPQCYGIEVPMRLLWEAYYTRQDISRAPLSQYDTGRPSVPGFQDFNIASLLAHRSTEDGQRAVLYQLAGSHDLLNPMELVMSYEEKGRVLPVASDFDGFLVGTRRVHYDPVTEALPPDQQDVLHWCVNNIQKILDAPLRPDSWSNRWLEVLKTESDRGFHPRIPRIGFGDPRSTSVMENAVSRLVDDGAVRHGAESFNYYFPQEIDDRFLVISDSLGPIPWAYMDVEELQGFLLDRIEEGFTFPLNPKWILCDPGWKELYDKLVSSDNRDTQDSMNIWFPIESGIREQIEKICERHPNGFERGARQ